MKRRIIAVITGLALLLAVAGSTGIIADSLGQPMTDSVHACANPGESGGGC